MSQWGDIVDAIEAHCRTAMSDMGADEIGFERNEAPTAGELARAQLPHVYCWHDAEAADPLDYNQYAIRYAVQLDIYVRAETQEALSVRLDTLRDTIEADPTLGGLVDACYVAQRGIAKPYPGKSERTAYVLVESRWVR